MLSGTPPTLAAIPTQNMLYTTDTIQVNLSATDPENDPITYSASVVAPKTLYELDQQYGFFIDANFPANNYFYNSRGVGEKYLRGTGDTWFLVFQSGELWQWNGSLTTMTKVANLSPKVFEDPTQLWNATPTSTTPVAASIVGNVLTLNPIPNFIGSVEVTVTANDGTGTNSKTFTLNVNNQVPILASIPDQTMVTTDPAKQIDVAAIDPDGAALTYTVAAVEGNQAYQLDQQYGFYIDANFLDQNYFYNTRGLGEKYLRGANNSWFLLYANGELKQWNGTVENQTLVAQLSSTYFNNPNLLWNPQALPADHLSVSIVGNTITIDPEDGFFGLYQVTVNVSDGFSTVHESFAVNVTANAPAPVSVTVEQLTSSTTSSDTGEKPQSKVWQQNGQWYSLFPNVDGAYIWRLDGTTWTQVLQVSTQTGVKADVKVNGNLVHILLANGANTELRTVEFANGTYQLWSLQPNTVPITGLVSGVETVTIDTDSTGRLWIAYEQELEIRVRYSDASSNYSTWSAPVVLATGVNSDDIAAIIAMPGKIGVFWSNQTTQRFGFRTHIDGTDPSIWTNDEIPASQSALAVGAGMGDDHIHLAVKSDGTLYAAVKTSYNVVGFPAVALLVRRPNGLWDDMYSIDPAGTRGVVQISETTGQIFYFYRDRDSSGPIVYRQLTDTGLGVVVGAEQILIVGDELNNASAMKSTFGNELVVIASGAGVLAGAKITLGSTPGGPTSAPDSYTVVEGGTLVANDANGTVGGADDNGVLVNDTTSGSGTLTALLVSQPAFGSVTLNSNGTFTYTHNGSENFTDSFTYRPQDGGGLGPITTVTITITPQNDAPVAVADSYTVGKGGTLQANDTNGSVAGTNNDSVLRNDTDAEGNTLNATLIAGVSNGTLTFNSNGTFTYVHNNGTSTSDSFTYRVNDGTVDGNTVTVNISVTTTPPTTVSFQDGVGGYTGTTDTYIIGSTPTVNQGTNAFIELDGNPDKAALIRWGLTGIPAGSTILSASIQLFVTDTSTDSFEIYSLLKSFTETQATYQRATTSVNWQVAGAQGATDRGTTVLGAATAPTAGLVTINLNAAGVALVQQWLNDPSSNFGLIIQDYADLSTNGLDFASSENATVANRPKLTLTYSTGGAPPSSPEVTTLGNNVSISDGDSTPSATDFTDFGSVAQGGTAISRSFTVRNDGTATLNLSALSVPTGYTITDTLVASLAAGASDTFTVRLDTATVGTKSGQISFTTNDSDENPFNFNITGTVTGTPAPEVTVLGNNVNITDGDTTPSATDFTDFGSVTLGGSTVSRTFTVRNDGTATLNLSALAVPTGFTITEGLSATLAAGASDTFTVRLDAATLGTKTGQISFTNSDGDENPFNFNITGTVSSSSPTTVTANFQDGTGGYTGTTDSYIIGSTPTTTQGTLTTMELDGNPDKAALIRWGLTGIPAGSTILSASIRLFVTDTSTDTFEIYNLLKSFNETQVNYQRSATGVNWQTAGAQGATDRGTTVLGGVTAPAAGLVTINLNAAGVAIVQQWLNDPSSNFGFIIQDYADVSTNGLDFASSENATVANRPRLTVTYSPPAVTAAGVASAEISGSVLKNSDLTAIQKAAAQRIISGAPASQQAAIAAALSKVSLSIASLPSGILGMASGNTILLDADAAGFGWFIDATPGDDLEFVRSGLSSSLTANGSHAGSMDLLTVVMHEMEHVLGDGHSDDGLMQESLAAGTRKLPAGGLTDAPLVDAVFADLNLL